MSNYTLIVDTTVASPEQVADCIISSLKEWKRNSSFKAVYISGERLNYPDDEPDGELIAFYSAKLDDGEEIPTARIFEEDGEFYVAEEAEAALARSFSEQPFFRATLVKGSSEGKKYVKMKNSL